MSAMPSEMAFRSHRVRSCSASGISSPSGPVRAGRRASVSSISASSPATSPSSGQEVVNGPGEPNRLVREIAALQVGADAAGVALVEDQVEHVQDGAESFGPLPVGGHAERHAGRLDALLGPADPLRHGRLGHQKRVGDLGRRQAADGPQRERDRRRTRERRMTAHEQQDERVVLIRLSPVELPSRASGRHAAGRPAPASPRRVSRRRRASSVRR